MQISDRPCLVVGGGEVALRKITQLVEFGANVTVVAPTFNAAIETLAEQQRIKTVASGFKAELISGNCLVIAASNDLRVNRQVSELARAENIPVNVVDNPELCTFIMPSIVNRDPVFIAVSSGGVSPILSRLLRARLETYIPASYGRLAKIIARFRTRVRRRFTDMRQRRRFWEQILQGPVEEMLYAGQEQAAITTLEHCLTQGHDNVTTRGEVYLVGGGPGDPDLLTFRALRLMQQADVVLYDRLVAKEVLALVRKDAERLFVGKQRDQHTIPQAEINQLLVDLAKQGKRVLRLKGGDPFIFGRGGEEIELLSRLGVPFQIVPGITAASGCASYAGIPLTHRDLAQSCLFVTGHLKDENLSLNWDAMIQPQQTIAIYMGMHGVEKLSHELINRGLAPDLPAAIIERGTTSSQKVYITSLQTLPNTAKRQRVKPPSMIIIGEVVKLHEQLAWYHPASSESG